MALTLKSAAEIAALITGQDFAALPLLLKQQIAGRLTGAADSLELVVPVLIANAASPLEVGFIKVLVNVGTVSRTNAAPQESLPWAPAITSVGDSAPASLEQVPTVGRAVPDLRMVYLPALDRLQTWLLYASSAATSNDGDGLPAVQRPLDFDAVANAKTWFRKS